MTLTTIAELLELFESGELTRHEFVHRHDPICVGCNNALEQYPRIPQEERIVMGPMPDYCSDCYEKSMRSYVETRPSSWFENRKFKL